ncbi:MAG: pilus assembly protein N-terminal domain-containing protein [bacterium]
MKFKRLISLATLFIFLLQMLLPFSFVSARSVRQIEVPLQGAEVLKMNSEISRVVLGNPELAEVSVVTTREILLVGNQRGVTTFHVWTEDGQQEFRLNISDSPERDDIDKEGLLRELGVVDEDGKELRMFTPQYRDLDDFEEYFDELLGEEGEILLSDQVAGQIYVLAPPELLDQIQELVDRLDVPDEEMQFTRRVDLENRSVTELIDKVDELLSEEGKAVLDEETNSILLVDKVSRVKEIENYLKGLDVATVAQVRIEARFMEMSEEASRKIGVDWSYEGTVDGSPADGSFSSSIGSEGLNMSLGNLGISGENFEAKMQMLESEGLANLISSPNVMTRNQQEATLEVLNERTYIADYDATAVEGTVEVTPVIETIAEGITLKATPLIAGEEVIQLSLAPELSIVTFEEKGITVAGDDRTIEIPSQDRRGVDLEVALKDGQTLVIGGLSRESSNNDENRVPLLGKIPLIGTYLFGYQSDEKESREINIFLTAEIVELDEQPEAASPSEIRDTVPEETKLLE